MKNNFFQEQREQSLIKAKIVSKYFDAWSKVILAVQKAHPDRTQRMAYIDLFAGPGRYDDQSKSTPIMVLETIISNPELAGRTLTWFNDRDLANIESLKQAISQISGIEKLKYPPAFYNVEVGNKIAEMFGTVNLVPSFFFVDPWGYKGLSLKLVSSIIKDWGSDCVFFFNYNRVNMGVSNEAIHAHMVSLFGEERLKLLQSECAGKTPDGRELIVVQALCDSLRQNGSRYVLPFRFLNDEGSRTSHHLIFLSKDFLGYDIMKGIMYKECSENIGGVVKFEYNPRDAHYKQGSLLDLLSTPLYALEGMLLRQYAGQTVDFITLYKDHSVDRPYIKKNYKDVFIKLLAEEKITAINQRTHNPPRKGTFSDEMQITFGAK